jgi:hypothetical protein
MRLSGRVEKMESQLPPPTRRRPVPTGSMTDFVQGLTSGAFTASDLDPTNADHVTLAARLAAMLVTLTPEHRAWVAANPWAPTPEAQWARAAPGVDSARVLIDAAHALGSPAQPKPESGSHHTRSPI